MAASFSNDPYLFSHGCRISHLTFCMLNLIITTTGGGTAKGKLVFVDLAGSERLKRSKNYDHAEETGAINKSLFTLAKVRAFEGVFGFSKEYSERYHIKHDDYTTE